LKVIPPVSNAVAADTKPAIPPTPFPSSYVDGGAPLPSEGTAANPTPDPGDVLRGLALNPLNVQPPSDPSSISLFGRGEYLVNSIADCGGCHTNRGGGGYLTGGQVFATPVPLEATFHTVRAASADLVGANHGFFSNPSVTFQTFLTLITQGVHAEDPVPQAKLAYPMPWQAFRNMDLGDLQAIYVYLSTVAGANVPALANDTVIPMPAIYCDANNACPAGAGTCSATSPECVTAGTCRTDLDCAACQVCEGASASDGGGDGGGTPGSCAALSSSAADGGTSPLAACQASGYPAFQ
ncbi:MAG: hypothetical protein ACREJ3_15390, partial [Polyangiaceae bacterium]